jgi:hypothetical protein
MASLGLQVTRVCVGDPQFAWARALEFALFGMANGFTSAADRDVGRMRWYDPYEASSEFYVARASTGEVAGLVRMIRHDPSRAMGSFSTVVDARSYAPPGQAPRTYLDDRWARFFARTAPDKFAELATQAVAREYRRMWVIEYLWFCMADTCRAEGVDFWTLALVLPLFRWYKRLFPGALEALGTTMPDYIGADSIPAIFHIRHPEVERHRVNFHEVCQRRGEPCQ